MKKAYQKPFAQLVDFSLSSSIANNCGTGSADVNDWGVFAEGCNLDGSDACYQVPYDQNSALS